MTDWPFVLTEPSKRTVNPFQILSDFWTSKTVGHVLEPVPFRMSLETCKSACSLYPSVPCLKRLCLFCLRYSVCIVGLLDYLIPVETFHSGMRMSVRNNFRNEIIPDDLYGYKNSDRHHVNEYRAIREPRDELVPERLLSRAKIM